MDWILKMAIKSDPDKYKLAEAPATVAAQIEQWVDALPDSEEGAFLKDPTGWLANIPIVEEGNNARRER